MKTEIHIERLAVIVAKPFTASVELFVNDGEIESARLLCTRMKSEIRELENHIKQLDTLEDEGGS